LFKTEQVDKDFDERPNQRGRADFSRGQCLVTPTSQEHLTHLHIV